MAEESKAQGKPAAAKKPAAKPAAGKQAPARAAPKQEAQKTVPAHWVSPMEEIDRFMERMFDSPLAGSWMRPFALDRLLPAAFRRAEAWVPAIDLIDRDDALVLRAEIPGVEKKDLDVSLTGNAVTIKGQVSREEKEEKGNYFRREMSRGMFSRTVTLPAGVDTANAKASFKDGVLELAMPKVEKAKRRTLKLD